jgi:hypothetical protein
MGQRVLLITIGLAALLTLTPSSASAATIPFHGTFRENFLRTPVDTQCPDSDACGPGAVERYGPAFQKEFDSDQGSSRVITLDDGSGSIVLQSTQVVIRDCLPPGASGSAPGQHVSFGNPFSCAGYVSVESGTGVFVGATGLLLEKIYAGGDVAVVTEEGTLTVPG